MKWTKTIILLAIAAIILTASIVVMWLFNRPRDLEYELLEIAGMIDGEAAFEHVKVLADDYYEGRLAGTAKCNESAAYIATKFNEYGLEPFGEDDTYFEIFSVTYWFAVEASLEILSPTEISGPYDCEPIEYCGSGNITAELVYVGLGGPEDYPDKNVTNRIAFALRGRYLSKDKVTWAYQHGAQAVIMLDQTYRVDSLLEPQEIPALFLRRDDGERILETMGFNIMKDSYLDPEDVIGSQLVFPKVQLYVDAVLGEDQPTMNVLGIIDGTDSTEYLLIGGHYDHLGVNKGEVYNGADDNAAGTAVVLELARVLSEYSRNKPPTKSIIFAAWTAEEKGLKGSEYFVETHQEILSNIEAVFNMDMNGAGEWVEEEPRNNMYIEDPLLGEGWLPEFVYNISQLLVVEEEIVLGVDYTSPYHQSIEYSLYSGVDSIRVVEYGGSSDHQPFSLAGIEATNVVTHSDNYPEYHKPGDDIALIDPAKLEISGQLVGCSAWKIACTSTTG